ncbi:hypothetical protein HD806DRAFT_519519 [Xylariaceae sp. AK1471]|nr:hypothetical protein HD806DRAFT_519519 [Xylariaceae sp. AK1471]
MYIDHLLGDWTAGNYELNRPEPNKNGLENAYCVPSRPMKKTRLRAGRGLLDPITGLVQSQIRLEGGNLVDRIERSSFNCIVTSASTAEDRYGDQCYIPCKQYHQILLEVMDTNTSPLGLAADHLPDYPRSQFWNSFASYGDKLGKKPSSTPSSQEDRCWLQHPCAQSADHAR